MEIKRSVCMSGTISDFSKIIKRLIDKYGKDALLEEVIKKEYNCNEVILN